MRRLADGGHEIRIAASSKECVTDLLQSLGWDFDLIDHPHEGSIFSLLTRLIRHNRRLISIAREFKPDVITAVGGTFAAQTGRILRIPSVVFYDTGEAKLQNAITYPFATRVVVPECYDAWVPQRKTCRYRGCHELAYLAPTVFRPQEGKARAAGWEPEHKTIILRLVSWSANHDLGLKGMDSGKTAQIVEQLMASGLAKVIISSEVELPASLERYRFKAPADYMHHLMAFADLYIGESATMASEAAVLGTPSILLGRAGRCYTRWLENQYGLIKHLESPELESVLQLAENPLSLDPAYYQEKRACFLHECSNVTKMIITEITQLIQSSQSTS